MKTLITLFLLSVACIGCRTETLSPANAELRKKLKAITVSDGISESEAEIFGQSYFARNIGCGAFMGIQDGKDRWTVDAKLGYGGEPVQGLFIDKRSGKVTSSIGPSYGNPLKIFP